jgi:CheY-like chemotaxis protein
MGDTYEGASGFDLHEAPTLQGSKIRPGLTDPLVLVVDDDEDAREIYCAALGHLGYRTMSRRNGKQAVEATRKHRPDAVLMDLSMPVLDGLEATRRIRADKRLRATFIIVMTAFGTARHTEAKAAGCDAFLCKPFNPFMLDEILRALRRHPRVDIVKRCGCGREYTGSEWSALPVCGTMEGIELRNCACGSSLAADRKRRRARRSAQTS